MTNKWRVERIPSQPPTRDEETNHITIPVWITHDGRHKADAKLTLLPSEAVALFDQLGGLLRDRTARSNALNNQGSVLAPGVTLVRHEE
ncbi:hypothetical protein V2J94_28445 [Streptomyces sp. DSM 41524]|uniref:Uncharacterized protein n=1 Tax=Streptomyces asiaticus subsp. ignotus TaxID=3098222 RepID=A0ABU7Q5X0_9ACTN|nr:hypothetical protein [Streptomyces sp. DSM 41524]